MFVNIRVEGVPVTFFTKVILHFELTDLGIQLLCLLFIVSSGVLFFCTKNIGRIAHHLYLLSMLSKKSPVLLKCPSITS